MSHPVRAESPAAFDRARLLSLLDADLDDAPTIADLRASGVRMPGQAIYELEVDGYPVERIRRRGDARRRGGIGYRLPRPRR